MYNNNPMARQQPPYYPSIPNSISLVQQTLLNKYIRGQTRMIYPDVNYQSSQLEDFHRFTPSPSFTHSPCKKIILQFFFLINISSFSTNDKHSGAIALC